jgi:small conductance mechanosensitive channel
MQFLANGEAAEGITEVVAETLGQLGEMEPEQFFASARIFFVGNAGKFLWTLLIFVAGFVFIRVVLRLGKRVLSRGGIDEAQHAFILSAIKIIGYMVLLVTCLGILGVPLTPMITALGAAGLALSLAVQDTLGNIAGGISVLFSRPFSKGNFVSVGSMTGTVMEIGLIYTLLHTVDNKHVYLPNGDVAKATIVNFSREKLRRLDLLFPVRAGADLDKVRRIILEEISLAPLAQKDPAPTVRASEQTLAVIKMICCVWVKPEDYLELSGYLIEHVQKRFTEEET